LAYQTLGDGPVDIAWQLEWLGNVDTVWERRPTAEWILGLATFSRVIIHDRRGTGASSRNVPLPTLEQRVTDLTAVLDAVDSRKTVLGGALEAGAPNVLFAATLPERVTSAFWWYPAPRTSRSEDYPFGADEQLLAAYRARIEQHWGMDQYVYPDLVATSPDYSVVPWGWLTRQTATPDVALEMDRIYNETDVRAAMPSMTCPVLLLAREKDLAPLNYLATLLRKPEIHALPGEGPMNRSTWNAPCKRSDCSSD
jgi:pimeloyl-ACP methyl ester carboxylesterase